MVPESPMTDQPVSREKQLRELEIVKFGVVTDGEWLMFSVENARRLEQRITDLTEMVRRLVIATEAGRPSFSLLTKAHQLLKEPFDKLRPAQGA